MAKPKKEYDLFQCKLEKHVSKELAEFCKETGRTKTAAVERAIMHYIAHYKRTGKS